MLHTHLLKTVRLKILKSKNIQHTDGDWIAFPTSKQSIITAIQLRTVEI